MIFTYSHIIILLLIAFLSAFLVVNTGYFFQRRLNIEQFNWTCDFRFNQNVLFNDELPESLKDSLAASYQASKKSFWKLLFSKKPLEVEYWFSPEEQQAFF